MNISRLILEKLPACFLATRKALERKWKALFGGGPKRPEPVEQQLELPMTVSRPARPGGAGKFQVAIPRRNR